MSDGGDDFADDEDFLDEAGSLVASSDGGSDDGSDDSEATGSTGDDSVADADPHLLRETTAPVARRRSPVLREANTARPVIIVTPRMTSDRMTRNEAAMLMAQRAAQIEKDGKYFVDAAGLNEASAIARKELASHRCPLKIWRGVGVDARGNSLVEEWSARELSLPPDL